MDEQTSLCFDLVRGKCPSIPLRGQTQDFGNDMKKVEQHLYDSINKKALFQHWYGSDLNVVRNRNPQNLEKWKLILAEVKRMSPALETQFWDFLLFHYPKVGVKLMKKIRIEKPLTVTEANPEQDDGDMEKPASELSHLVHATMQ